ncbi:MAG: DUF262 domain-containing protein [Epsilonproteobacteria bacterium]|nr:MAG: DUF262 domain-containing protein [Campylobacterota bacterium]
MGLKPKDKTVSEIFKQIDYGIDFYQREYKWTDDTSGYKPLKSLLDDIFYRFNIDYKDNLDPTNPKNLDEFEWYYLNSFMTNSVGGTKFIVDGQQRLTTLTLIHISLYHLAKKYDLPSHLIDTLKKSIYDTTDFGASYCMGVKDRKDSIENLFTNHLENFKEDGYLNVSEKNIYKNYKTICTILANYLISKDTELTKNKLHFFTLYFRKKVYLIEIEIEKTKDVPMVFEVINDRGIPLKPYEILKGKVLGQINKNDINLYLDIWEKRVSQLEEYDEDEIDEFFSFYFKSKLSDTSEQYKKLDKSKYHKSIFTEDFDIKIGLKHNEKNVKNFVEVQFSYYCDTYLFMIDKYWNYDKEYEHIFFNRLNDINGQFPLMLSCLIPNDTVKEDKLKLVSKLFDRNFVILNLTDSYSSNNFNSSLMVLVKNIRDMNLSEIKKEFDIQLLKDVKKSKDIGSLSEAFKYEFFRNIGYTKLGKKFLRYFFARIEYYISDFSNRPTKTYEQLVLQSRGQEVHHIEHIITNNEENLTLFENEEEFHIQRNRLGGLLLLKGKDNISSGDELYADKLRTYNINGTLYSQTLLEDNYKSNVEFSNFIQSEELDFKPFNTYSKYEIEERHQLLFELVKRIWDIDIDENINIEDINIVNDDYENEEVDEKSNSKVTSTNEVIQRLHEVIFQSLYGRYEENKEFLFTVRQNNNKERLDKGYWFIGNNDYLITSFWSGRDWKNKTPNISLVFLPTHSNDRRDDREDCFIELTSKSHQETTVFMQNIMNKIDGFKKRTNGCWFLPINQNGYLASLEYFIKTYKPIIDGCIREYKPTNIGFLEHNYAKYIDRIVDRRS